jgi:NADH-quinone oxidoreductase subunit L
MVEAIRNLLPSLLWWIPLLPLLAGGVIAFLPDTRGQLASKLAMGALAISCVISGMAFVSTWVPENEGLAFRVANSFVWLTYGDVPLTLGLLLDPMSASMVAMVTFVALWIFIYSVGYMKTEARFGRFIGFLSLFCGAMLLLVLSNSLLLLFMAWEVVGLASYMLIGFYFEKPSAAAAAQKAFITTRIGDMAFLVGMIWLYQESGTLLFYDHGNGLLESGALSSLAGVTTFGGLSVSAAAALLLLVGAMGKSGQVPLHTWLPDAMEGPTPVSALIHAATMVAAGVFLVARTHPIFANGGGVTVPLAACAWIGGLTALYAALVAVAQNDIKRILAYSTVSQLGFMMVALGTGGVTAAMLHLIAHAFFKALLFLSAGSVIHGCHGEQDIRRMGGLAKAMPRTFITYAIGMMALSGFPFVFAGFWSKEAILHSAETWPGGHGPFLLAVVAALLTAFYMTRQALLVFFGSPRVPGVSHPHESPSVMIVPLVVLATGVVLISTVASPVWPWFERWMSGENATLNWGALAHPEAVKLIGLSLAIVFVGVGISWMVYRNAGRDSNAPDPAQKALGRVWGFLSEGMKFDALYDHTVIGPLRFFSGAVDALDRSVLVPLMLMAESGFTAFGRLTGWSDEAGLNRGFNRFCEGLRNRAASASQSQSGQPQAYLRTIGIGMSLLLVLYFWISA